MTIPTDPKSRKCAPLFSGVLKYFPDALLAVSECSRVGNEQHNPGAPLHWDRSKSTDEADALARHLLQVGEIDTDGVPHTVKVAWRALALLQKEIEARASETVVTVTDTAPPSPPAPKFKVGDVVRAGGGRGDVVEYGPRYQTYLVKQLTGGTCWYVEDELAPVTQLEDAPPAPPPPAPKFKVGDVVRKAGPGPLALNGVIQAYDRVDQTYAVRTNKGYTFWALERELAFDAPGATSEVTPPAPKFKVGDTVLAEDSFVDVVEYDPQDQTYLVKLPTGDTYWYEEHELAPVTSRPEDAPRG